MERRLQETDGKDCREGGLLAVGELKRENDGDGEEEDEEVGYDDHAGGHVG